MNKRQKKLAKRRNNIPKVQARRERHLQLVEVKQAQDLKIIEIINNPMIDKSHLKEVISKVRSGEL